MRTWFKGHVVLVAMSFVLSVGILQAEDLAPAAYGSVPLLNGLIGEFEWTSPTAHKSGWDTGTIWLIKDSQYVYLCIAPGDTVHTGLDLYLDNLAGEVFMLHISSAHGQRFLSDTLWQEMTWGPAKLWTSNLIQSIFRDGRNVWLAPDAFEFQIDRQFLPHESFKMMLHLKRPERWVPPDADSLSSQEWMQIERDNAPSE